MIHFSSSSCALTHYVYSLIIEEILLLLATQITHFKYPIIILFWLGTRLTWERDNTEKNFFMIIQKTNLLSDWERNRMDYYSVMKLERTEQKKNYPKKTEIASLIDTRQLSNHDSLLIFLQVNYPIFFFHEQIQKFILFTLYYFFYYFQINVNEIRDVVSSRLERIMMNKNVFVQGGETRVWLCGERSEVGYERAYCVGYIGYHLDKSVLVSERERGLPIDNEFDWGNEWIERGW